MILECPYIKRVQVPDGQEVELLRESAGLDAGESEAIILTDTVKVDFLLMDEILSCIDKFKASQRHISDKLYAQLVDKLDGSVSDVDNE